MNPQRKVSSTFNRRQWLGAVAVTGVAAAAPVAAVQSPTGRPPQIHFALNMSTVRGQKLSVPEQVELAAKAGYDGIEPWIGELREYQQSGGSLDDVRKRIADGGLKVPSAIGFAQWVVSDEKMRTAGLEQMKRDMEIVRAIGGTHIAAPPAGATRETDFKLTDAAERYRAVLELGVREGVIPQLEIWGPSAVLSKLSEALFAAAESQHPSACLLLDVYHLYKGGSGFSGLKLVSGNVLHCLHFNDYEATPPRESIRDADRVYPGDGIAPLSQIIQDLAANGFQGYLSLELFNQTYWKEDAAVVARIGLKKMQDAVAKALS